MGGHTSKWEVNWLNVENWHLRESHSEANKRTDLEAKLQQASDIVEFMEHVMAYEEWIGELEKVTSELEETRQKLERETCKLEEARVSWRTSTPRLRGSVRQ